MLCTAANREEPQSTSLFPSPFEGQPSDFKSHRPCLCGPEAQLTSSFLKGLSQGREKSRSKVITELRITG